MTKAAPGLSAISSSFTSKPPLPLETANMGLFRLSLGHSDPKMTLRYAHVSDRDVEAAAERIGKVIETAMLAITQKRAYSLI